jgi:hypothetical protein
MRWHLCDYLGLSQRTTDAPDLFWARRKFAPIPKGYFVVSDASYRIPRIETVILCSKCFRNLVSDGLVTCEPCRMTKRNAYRRMHGLDPIAVPKAPTERKAAPPVELPEPTGPVMRTTEVAKRLGVAIKSVFSKMAKYGFTPVQGYVPPLKMGRPERQWHTADVKHVQAKLNAERSRTATILRGIEHRRAKRQLIGA